MGGQPAGTARDGAARTLPGYLRLRRSGISARAHVGLLLGLGSFLTLFGGGIASLFLVERGRDGSWVSLLVGGAFAGTGLLLLYAGTKAFRGLRVAPTCLFLQEGADLRPGAAARLRVVQPGPVDLDSLVVRLLCERVYRRRTGRGRATVEDRELLHQQELVSAANASVPAGKRFEREVILTVPLDARPDGPALPDGRISWRIEVSGDAGVLRAIHHSFDVAVHSAARP